jgi:16S rRNA processing protein RimM
MSHRLIIVGKTLKPVGLKGALRIYPYTESIDVYRRFPFLYFGTECFEVEKVGDNRKLVTISLKNINSLEDAKKLTGRLVKASAEFFPSKEDEEYYWFELIDLSVSDVQGRSVGKVESLIRTPAHDILEVRQDKKEVLIPLVDGIVQKIDLEKGQILVNLLEGMSPDD